MNRYCLTWRFHQYTIHLEEKEIVDRIEYFDKFEDLLASFRKYVKAEFMGFIKYNTDFKVFTVEYKEQDIAKLSALLGEADTPKTTNAPNKTNISKHKNNCFWCEGTQDWEYEND